MTFRDDQEAAHARNRALEEELEALREHRSEDQRAALERKRALEKELEETRQALARAKWRSRGAKGSGNASEADEEPSEEASRVESEEVKSRATLPEWQWQLAIFLGGVLLFVILGWLAYGKLTGGLDLAE